MKIFSRKKISTVANIFHHAFDDKTFVFILSTMRSGSTLLKALLANAPDTSYLPEINFNKYTWYTTWRLNLLSHKKIIVIKKPAWFHENNYPRLPRVKNQKRIFLVRDVYDTVVSIKAMNKAISAEADKEWSYDNLVHSYWLYITKNILDNPLLNEQNSILIRYEDLVQDPIKTTKPLFEFIGSKQNQGVDKYHPPQSYEWDWGLDDGGEKIKTLKVQHIPKKRDNQELIEIIAASESVRMIRKKLGYV
jgi:hypothetical protein